MRSIDDIFQGFGGTSAVAEALGITRTHAGAMKTRGSIPSEYWERLVSAATERDVEGITLEALARIAAARGKPRTPQNATHTDPRVASDNGTRDGNNQSNQGCGAAEAAE